MPGTWNYRRVVELIKMMQELLEAFDLTDDEADAVVAVLLPKLRQRSGLDVSAFRAAVCAALSNPDRVAFFRRR